MESYDEAIYNLCFIFIDIFIYGFILLKIQLITYLFCSLELTTSINKDFLLILVRLSLTAVESRKSVLYLLI